jgi:hypothetical protein
MFERFSTASRQVIFVARAEAGLVGSPFIDTEHVLLGIPGHFLFSGSGDMQPGGILPRQRFLHPLISRSVLIQRRSSTRPHRWPTFIGVISSGQNICCLHSRLCWNPILRWRWKKEVSPWIGWRLCCLDCLRQNSKQGIRWSWKTCSLKCSKLAISEARCKSIAG